jgi:hypothetical protein
VSDPRTGEPASPYAEPVAVASLSECYYYHTMDVPGHGVVEGEWDLRAGADAYLGHEPVGGKRVLELGTASGFLCFEMERRGAEVVAYDLGPGDPWDVVPFGGPERARAVLAERGEHIARINKSWWFNHRAFGSRARVVYGTVYAIPRSIGAVDVATFGAILLHLRDPFLALQRAAELAPHTIVVTELARRSLRAPVEGAARRRSPLFLPDAARGEPVDGWWSFTPQAVSNMLGVLGYRTERVVRHHQLYRQRRTPMFTVVARRA